MPPPPNSLSHDPSTKPPLNIVPLNRLRNANHDDFIPLEAVQEIMRQLFGMDSRYQRHNYGDDGSDYKYAM